jgi:hypothetical protein
MWSPVVAGSPSCAAASEKSFHSAYSAPENDFGIPSVSRTS